MARYITQARKCKKFIKKFHVKSEKLFLSRNNITAFYRHVNKRLNSAHRVAPIRNVNNSIITDDISKAQAFNSYFTSVFNAKPSSPRSVTIDNYKTIHSSLEIDFSLNNVFCALKNAKRSFSLGLYSFSSLGKCCRYGSFSCFRCFFIILPACCASR